MDLTIWNIILTGAIGLISWLARAMYSEMQRISILLNRTREEIAKEYVTKSEVSTNINRVVDRLDALDAKLDRMMESRANRGA